MIFLCKWVVPSLKLRAKNVTSKFQVWKMILFIWGCHLETILCAIQPCEGLTPFYSQNFYGNLKCMGKNHNNSGWFELSPWNFMGKYIHQSGDWRWFFHPEIVWCPFFQRKITTPWKLTNLSLQKCWARKMKGLLFGWHFSEFSGE